MQVSSRLSSPFFSTNRRQLPGGALPTAARHRSNQTLLRAHHTLIEEIAQSHVRPHLPLEDLIAEGQLALLEAAQRFSAKSPLLFSEFAALWVRRAVVRYVAHNAHAVADLDDDSDFDGNFMAVADSVALSDINVDTDSEDGEGFDPADSLPDPEEYAASAENAPPGGVQHQVVMAMQALSGQERYVVRRRFMTREQAPLASLGHAMHLPVEMVRRLEAQAVAKLRDVVNPRHDD